MINLPPLVCTRVLTFFLLSSSAAASEWLGGENTPETLKRYILRQLTNQNQFDKSVVDYFKSFNPELTIICLTMLDAFRFGLIGKFEKRIEEPLRGVKSTDFTVVEIDLAQPIYGNAELVKTDSEEKTNDNPEPVPANGCKEEDKRGKGKKKEKLDSSSTTPSENTDHTNTHSHVVSALFYFLVDQNVFEPEKLTVVSSGKLQEGPIFQEVHDVSTTVINDDKLSSNLPVKIDQPTWIFENTEKAKQSVGIFEDENTPLILTNTPANVDIDSLIKEVQTELSFHNWSIARSGTPTYRLLGTFVHAVQDQNVVQPTFHFFEQTYKQPVGLKSYVVTVTESGKFLKTIGPFLNLEDAQKAMRLHCKTHMVWILPQPSNSSSASTSEEDKLKRKSENEQVTRQIQELIYGAIQSPAKVEESGSDYGSTSLPNSEPGVTRVQQDSTEQKPLVIKLLRSAEISISSDSVVQFTSVGNEGNTVSKIVYVKLYAIVQKYLSDRHLVGFYGNHLEAELIYSKIFQQKNSLCSTETKTFIRWFKECSTEKKLPIRQSPVTAQSIIPKKEIHRTIYQMCMYCPPEGTKNMTLTTLVKKTMGIFTSQGHTSQRGMPVTYNFVIVIISFANNSMMVPVYSAVMVAILRKGQNPRVVPKFFSTVEEAISFIGENNSIIIFAEKLPSSISDFNSSLTDQIRNELRVVHGFYTEPISVNLLTMLTFHENEETDTDLMAYAACKVVGTSENKKEAFLTVLFDLAKPQLLGVYELETSFEKLVEHASSSLVPWSKTSETTTSEMIKNRFDQMLISKEIMKTNLTKLVAPQTLSIISASPLTVSTAELEDMKTLTPPVKVWTYTARWISHYMEGTTSVTIVIFEVKYYGPVNSYIAMAYRSSSASYTPSSEGNRDDKLDFTRFVVNVETLFRLLKSDFANLRGVKHAERPTIWNMYSFPHIPFAKEISTSVEEFRLIVNNFVEKELKIKLEEHRIWKYGVMGYDGPIFTWVVLIVRWNAMPSQLNGGEEWRQAFVLIGIPPATVVTDTAKFTPMLVPTLLRCSAEIEDFVVGYPVIFAN